MKRRKFITLAAATPFLPIIGCSSNMSDSNTPSSTLNNLKTGSTLLIPPLLNPDLVNGVKIFNLSIQESTHEFISGTNTNTFGIDASYLGPTLLLRNGENVSIRFTNNLQETTTMHGHGMHVPAEMDGGPHQQITSGNTWNADYTVNQKACTNWYHPHLLGKTADQVYKGLAGLIIIEDTESDSLSLPKTYGTDDIPLVVQDRVFNSEGQFDYSPSMMEIMQGYKGDIYLVNGQIEPVFAAKNGLLRIRLLNGSNAGVYNFGFSDNRSFSQIATDNSFLENPVSLTRVLLSPGERAEIIVDLSADTDSTIKLMEYNANKTLLNIDVTTGASLNTIIPASLTTLNKLDSAAAVRTRSFSFTGGQGSLYINGKQMDMNRIDETVPLNDIEIWEITNNMGMAHNFHIHATYFMILDRNGSPSAVAANEKGYKDTVYVPGGQSVRFIVKMTDFSDNTTPYMYHCHFLEHEDAGMMGQFVTV